MTRQSCMSPASRTIVAVLVGALSCGADEERTTSTTLQALYAQDYRASYMELRSCRKSGDHDLAYVRVLGTADAAAAYLERSSSFSEGAVLVKEQYDFADSACAGTVDMVTVMLRDSDFEAGLGWRWQRTDGAGRVLGEDEPRCIGCHADCGLPPSGFDGTCATP